MEITTKLQGKKRKLLIVTTKRQRNILTAPTASQHFFSDRELKRKREQNSKYLLFFVPQFQHSTDAPHIKEALAYQCSPFYSSVAYSQDGKSIHIHPWCSHNPAHNLHCSHCIHLYLRGKGNIIIIITYQFVRFLAEDISKFCVLRSSCCVQLTSAVGQPIHGVAFVAQTLKTTRGVHTRVITCPLKKTLIYICNQNQAGDIIAGQSVAIFIRRDFPPTDTFDPEVSHSCTVMLHHLRMVITGKKMAAFHWDALNCSRSASLKAQIQRLTKGAGFIT